MAKRLGLLLLMVALVSLSLPVHIALAVVTTTVEVNSGNTITLGVGQSIRASGTSGIPVAVKNLPNLGAPANGLAAFQFDFSWNPNVLRVDSLTKSNDALARGWSLFSDTINNSTGTVAVAGFTTTFSTADVILLYFGITAVGTAGSSTSINVTITTLYDKDNVTIPATPVNAPVSIPMVELVSIAVTPAAPSIMLGETQQFTATGTYTLGTADITSIVTWSSSNTTVTIISTTGLATSLAAGTTAIIATLYPINGTTILTVTEAKTEEVVVASPAEAEPGITDVSDSDKNGVFTEEATAESEAGKVEPTVDEGTTRVKASPTKPTNLWLIGAIIAGVVVVGVVIWLALRRRTS